MTVSSPFRGPHPGVGGRQQLKPGYRLLCVYAMEAQHEGLCPVHRVCRAMGRDVSSSSANLPWSSSEILVELKDFFDFASKSPGVETTDNGAGARLRGLVLWLSASCHPNFLLPGIAYTLYLIAVSRRLIPGE